MEEERLFGALQHIGTQVNNARNSNETMLSVHTTVILTRCVFLGAATTILAKHDFYNILYSLNSLLKNFLTSTDLSAQETPLIACARKSAGSNEADKKSLKGGLYNKIRLS